MKRLIYYLLITLVTLMSPYAWAQAGTAQRVVSVGGSITEIVYQLGEEKRLVGTDMSSLYPPAAQQLPQIGYYRSLPVEGLLSLQPDLILASEQAGPATTLNTLRTLHMPLAIISEQAELESLYLRIQQVAEALQVPQRGQELIHQVRTEIEQALQNKPPVSKNKPVRTLVLMKHSSQLLAAGAKTTANALLELAGLDNLMANTHQGYQPISTESLATLQPDLIITTTRSAEGLGSQGAFAQSAGVALTPAAKNNHILVMEDLLILGLGPRTGQALEQLIQAHNQVVNPL